MHLLLGRLAVFDNEADYRGTHMGGRFLACLLT